MASRTLTQPNTAIEDTLAIAEREIVEAIDIITGWANASEDRRDDLIAYWPVTIDFYRRSVTNANQGLLTSQQMERLNALHDRYQVHQALFAQVLGVHWARIDPV